MKKLFSLFAILLVALSFISSGIAQAAFYTTQSNDEKLITEALACETPFTITDVEVEGVDLSTGTDPSDVVNVQRGDSLNVRVEVTGTTGCNSDDVKVKTWIGGYEYDDIEDDTSLFDVTGGITYVKNLVLEIPNDIGLDDNNNDNGDNEDTFTLHVEAFNDDDSDELEYDVLIEAQRHYLNFVDVIFNPGLSVKNTQPLFVTVRLENLGDKKEEDVKVEVSIPELGMSQVTYIDELVAMENGNDDDEETSESSDTLLLDLSNVKADTYDLVVSADYNRGHDTISQSYQLVVTGVTGIQPSEDLMVQAFTSSQNVNQGGSVDYTFSVANLGSESKTLTFEVTGQEAWATAKVEPIALTVLPDSTRDVKVTINAKSDADLGSKIFVVRVKDASGMVVEELQLEADVQGTSTDSVSDLRSGLEIGFIVLLIILVILGIILAVSKMKGKEETGESYY